MSALFLLLKQIFLQLLDYLAVSVGGSPFRFICSSFKLTLVFEGIKYKLACLCILDSDFFASLQECSIDGNIGVDSYGIVINKVSFPHGTLVVISINYVLK